MPSGFELYSANGNTLNISNDYMNLSLFSSGLVSTLLPMLTNFAEGKTFRGSINVPITNPVVAIEVAEGKYVTVYDSNQTANSFTFDVWMETATDPSTLKYYVFSAGNISGRNYGKVVYHNVTGLCVFDAMLKYLRVIGAGTITTDKGKVAMLAQGRSGTYNRMYVGMASGQRRYDDSETFTVYARSGSNIISKNVTVSYGYVLKSYALPDGFISQRGMPMALMIDVTNY